MPAHVSDSLTGDPPEPDIEQMLPFASHHDLAATASDAMAAVGSLVLDKNGIIRFCSAAVARLASMTVVGLDRAAYQVIVSATAIQSWHSWLQRRFCNVFIRRRCLAFLIAGESGWRADDGRCLV